MAVSALGVLTIVFYYLVVVLLGFWAARKAQPDDSQPWSSRSRVSTSKLKGAEGSGYFVKLFIANRSLPLALTSISMTATWVGGGYINGNADAVFNYGLLWCHAPIGYALSLFLGGRLFAGKMRCTKALTMLDPFQQHYGRWIAVILCFPAVCADVFWTASILAALGNAANSMIELNSAQSIMLSATVILSYTALGGYYSVVYTDIFQLTSTAIGLWICVPFVLTNSAAGQLGPPQDDWIGIVENQDLSQIFDHMLTTIFGSIPCQVYFQGVLGSDNAFSAQMLSYLAAVGCLVLAAPSVIIGAVAKSTNFTAMGYPGPHNLITEHRTNVLPTAIHYMTPSSVSTLGLTAITAAIMSSADSSMLSASCLITRNIYHFIIRPTASDGEVVLALRCVLFLVCTVSTIMAVSVGSVLTLWTLSSDLVYVLLFPQFVSLFFLKKDSNAYGSVVGFLVGVVVRALCGEPNLNVPAVLRLPLYDKERGQQFPFRTLCMLLSLSSALLTSALAAAAFHCKLIPERLDVWRCFAPSAADVRLRFSGDVATVVNDRVAATAPTKTTLFPNAASEANSETTLSSSNTSVELLSHEATGNESGVGQHFSPQFAEISREPTLSSTAEGQQQSGATLKSRRRRRSSSAPAKSGREDAAADAKDALRSQRRTAKLKRVKASSGETRNCEPKNGDVPEKSGAAPSRRKAKAGKRAAAKKVKRGASKVANETTTSSTTPTTGTTSFKAADSATSATEGAVSTTAVDPQMTSTPSPVASAVEAATTGFSMPAYGVATDGRAREPCVDESGAQKVVSKERNTDSKGVPSKRRKAKAL